VKKGSGLEGSFLNGRTHFPPCHALMQALYRVEIGVGVCRRSQDVVLGLVQALTGSQRGEV
jgi:thymidylate synthase